MAVKAGFLTKEGGSIKTWKKRWCVLKNGALHYSKSQSSGDLGIVNLDNAGDIKKSNRKRKNCFEIVTPARVYFMCAESPGALEDWIRELTAERDRIQGKRKLTVDSNGAPLPAPPAGQPERVTLEDFELLTVIGRGSFGKVIQVRKKDNQKIYAMKVLNKKNILDRGEVEHTKSEKSILMKLCHPFLVNLNYSFQTGDKLYFVMDYVNGGELFFHLQQNKKFTEERARFYCAEIVLGLEYLHNSGVLYRDLKPENLLLTGDGHICMTDFGISKEGLHCEDDRTATFCGTPEYLAPEVLENVPYGKPVDWWSFGTLMFEMLTGLPPFYDSDVQKMYQKIMTAKLVFANPVPADARDLLEKLLVREPEQRLSDPVQIKKHPWFSSIDWSKLAKKEITPPFIPPVKSLEDTSQVDPEFTSEPTVLTYNPTSEIPADGAFVGFTYVAPTAL